MCIHGPKNSYLGKSTPHPSGQETIPILSLGASPLGIELKLPLGPRDIGVDFPRYEFLSPWIPPIHGFTILLGSDFMSNFMGSSAKILEIHGFTGTQGTRPNAAPAVAKPLY